MADYNSSLPVRTESAGDIISKISDATTPSQQLKVNADGSIDTNFATGSEVKITDGTDTLLVNADGSIAITDNGGSLTVDGTVTATATDLDIRDLAHTQDSVKVGDGTDFLAIAADGSIAVTDNGGSLTVDGTVTATATDLDIRDLAHTQDSVKVGDGTDFLAINGDGSINTTVSATDLDIRDLTAASDSVAAHLFDEAGTAFSATNPLPVAMVDVEGTEVNDYDTTASVASGATDNHDYTTAGAFKLRTVWASASSKLKIEVQIETAAASGVFNTVFVGFTSTANPNIELPVRDAISVASGARVRVIRTNKDNQSQDVYSTISGFLV